VGRPGAVIGVDTGGTFTDVILLDPASGRIVTAKTASTPADPSRGFSAGVESALEQAGLGGKAIERVLHGTTVATNLILEGKGWSTSLTAVPLFAGRCWNPCRSGSAYRRADRAVDDSRV
jgi:N-methylhydantoinase A